MVIYGLLPSGARKRREPCWNGRRPEGTNLQRFVCWIAPDIEAVRQIDWRFVLSCFQAEKETLQQELRTAQKDAKEAHFVNRCQQYH